MPSPNTNLFVSKWFCFINIHSITCGFHITHTTDDVIITWLTEIFISRFISHIIRYLICINTIRIYTLNTVFRLFIFYFKHTKTTDSPFTDNHSIFISFICPRKSPYHLSYGCWRSAFCLKFIIWIGA